MQDYTGIPAIADLAAMRDKMAKTKTKLINPIVPVSLVVLLISVDSSSKNNQCY